MTTTVLVVDDDIDVARTYRRYLADAYAVREAHAGEEALSALDEAVDVVLLDRLMPDCSGDEVLARIRDRDLGVRVAMVTAVEPSFDVVEMGFDAYVTKPATREELVETVEELLALNRHADEVRTYHSLLARLAALHDGTTPPERDRSDAYADLQARISALESTLEAEASRLTDDAAFVATLRAIDAPTFTEERSDG